MSTTAMSTQIRYGFTPEQVNVIKQTIAPGATDTELALFLMVCEKSGLDPFSRQIYLSERRSRDPKTDQWVVKKSPETTIDGFRVIAERSGLYAGQVGPLWCGDDGEWKDVWLSRDKMPTACKVGVLRKDFKEPVWGVALFDEYVQTTRDNKPNSMWSKMGANQLAKCAESLALRKAFPRDLSGFYSKEEMGQTNESRSAQVEVMEAKLAAIPPKQIAPVPPERVYEIIEEEEAKAPIDIQERHEKQQAEAREAMAPEPKEHRIKGDINFKHLSELGKQKKALRELTQSDDLYYEVLQTIGVNHADELSEGQYKTAWKPLEEIRRRLLNDLQKSKIDGERRSAMTKEWERLGTERFIQCLGNSGYENLDQFLADASPEIEDRVLRELRSL